MNNILSIIICCRNEIHTIEKILNKINKLSLTHPWKKEVVIVDNCSTDGTREVLSKINREDTTIIFQEKNIGKGHSVKTGIKYCNGHFVIPQDGDLEYDPNDIKRILNYSLKNNCDFVIGTRFEKGKRFHKYWINEIGANILTYVFNILFKTNFTDVASCYKLMKLDLVKNFTLNCNGFDLDYELCSKFSKIKSNAGEIKINYSARSFKEGRNTIFNKNNVYIDGLKALFVMLKVKFF